MNNPLTTNHQPRTKVGLFGGVFNPPHIGHQLIARQILDYTDVDEIWYLPNFGQSPPKPHVAPPEDRIAMVKFLEFDRAKVSTIEIDNRLDGKTFHLLPFLPKNYTYVFIMGSDWLAGFTAWDRWEELLQKLPFYVFPRNGYPCEPLQNGMTEVKHQDLVVTNLSSTMIRNRIAQGLSIAGFVPPGVEEYINKNKLYGKG